MTNNKIPTVTGWGPLHRGMEKTPKTYLKSSGRHLFSDLLAFCSSNIAYNFLVAFSSSFFYYIFDERNVEVIMNCFIWDFGLSSFENRYARLAHTAPHFGTIFPYRLSVLFTRTLFSNVSSVRVNILLNLRSIFFLFLQYILSRYSQILSVNQI